jgi:hypothetical protein
MMRWRAGPEGAAVSGRGEAKTSSSLVFLVLCCTVACTGRHPRDVSNQNPRSELVDGPGSPGPTRDAGSALGVDRVIARPAVGLAPREIAKASARAIVTSPTHVFFGDSEDDALYALSKKGGSPMRIARRDPMPGALAIDTDSSTLAWIGSPGDVVLRVPTNGGTVTTVRDRGIFTDVAASGGDVFFTEARDEAGILTRVTGTTAARLAAVEGAPRGIAIDAQHVYLATSSRLAVTPRTRGEVIDLATGAAFANPLLDETWLYATAVDPKSRVREIVRVKKTGGTLETIVTGIRDAPTALYKGTLYWFDPDRPALLSSSGARPSPRTVCEDAQLERPSAITVDDDGVFVATGYGEGARILVIPLR